MRDLWDTTGTAPKQRSKQRLRRGAGFDPSSLRDIFIGGGRLRVLFWCGGILGWLILIFAIIMTAIGA